MFNLTNMVGRFSKNRKRTKKNIIKAKIALIVQTVEAENRFVHCSISVRQYPIMIGPHMNLNQIQTDTDSETNCNSQAHSHALLDSPLENNFPDFVMKMIGLLGTKAVLIPIVGGNKRPSFEDWQKYDQEFMRDPMYARIWSEHSDLFTNAAVVVGEPSGGLCSIDIDDDDMVEPFLILNPKFRQTLTSRRARGCNFWVQIRGEYPASKKLLTRDVTPMGEWRATGNCTMIYGWHSSGHSYRRNPEVPPIEIDFNEIVWPDEIASSWAETNSEPETEHVESSDKLVVEHFGMPAVFSASKDGEKFARAINEPYWGGLYNTEKIILFEPNEQTFFEYSPDTGLYSVVSRDFIMQQISFRILEEARKNPSLSNLANLRNERNLNAVVTQLKGIAEHRDAFVNRPKAVHLANCMLVLDKGSFKTVAFSPEFRSRNRSPISFDPNAQCQRFLNELILPAVSEDDVILLQKMFGQFLLGDNLIQRFLVLDGLAGRGKTQFAILVQAIIGQVNCTQLRTNLLGGRFEISRLLNRSLLIGVDVKADFLSHEDANAIKGLVGGDWFDAERKKSNNSFPVEGNLNILMTSNGRLKVRLNGDVGAWKRRMLIVRYECSKPIKKIPKFGSLLVHEEGSGIINWALEGLLMLFDDIEKYGDIQMTQRQTDIVDSLLAESESLRHFLLSNVVKAPGSDLSVDEIISTYAHYCPDQGWVPLPESQIGRQLPSLMLELYQTPKSHSCSRNGRSVRGYRGVALKEETP